MVKHNVYGHHKMLLKKAKFAVNVFKMKQGRIKSNSICFTDIRSDLTQFESVSGIGKRASYFLLIYGA